MKQNNYGKIVSDVMMEVWNRMNMFTDIDFEVEISKQRGAIVQFVEDNLKNKDEEGYAFLTNIKKREEMPFQFAIVFDFKQPIFKIKKPLRSKGISNRQYDKLCCTHEGIWVKEGLE